MDAERTPSVRPSIALLLDGAERVLIVALYLGLVARLIASMEDGGSIVNGLLLVSEGLVIVFLLARRKTRNVSPNPLDWLLAIGATCGPLLVRPGAGTPIVPQAWAACVWLMGTSLQV